MKIIITENKLRDLQLQYLNNSIGDVSEFDTFIVLYYPSNGDDDDFDRSRVVGVIRVMMFDGVQLTEELRDARDDHIRLVFIAQTLRLRVGMGLSLKMHPCKGGKGGCRVFVLLVAEAGQQPVDTEWAGQRMGGWGDAHGVPHESHEVVVAGRPAGQQSVTVDDRGEKASQWGWQAVGGL